MPLTRQEVEHIAGLARLELTQEEAARFQEQLSAILDYAQALQQLDTEAIPPTAHILSRSNVTRPDRARPSWPRQDILANAPAAQDGMFKVKAVRP